MFKKHMTPLSKGGQMVSHKGKGAAPFPPKPNPLQALTQGAPSMNNYAKASPMPNAPPAGPMGGPQGAMGMSPPIGPPIGGGSPGQDQGGI